jgi:hypothetical protein
MGALPAALHLCVLISTDIYIGASANLAVVGHGWPGLITAAGRTAGFVMTLPAKDGGNSISGFFVVRATDVACDRRCLRPVAHARRPVPENRPPGTWITFSTIPDGSFSTH